MTTLAHPPIPATSTTYLIRRSVALAVLVVLLVGAFLAFSGTVGADGPVPSEAYVVRSGDTLWELAADRTGPGGDVRAVMADIVDLNGLSSTSLSVGQPLDLPLVP